MRLVPEHHFEIKFVNCFRYGNELTCKANGWHHRHSVLMDRTRWIAITFAPRTLEVAFNNILRKIWHLLFNSHTRILHLTARLQSTFSMISQRSKSLFLAATQSKTCLLRVVFSQSAKLCYTPTGFNCLYSQLHLKKYYPEDAVCANIIRTFRLSSSTSSDNEHIITTIACN